MFFVPAYIFILVFTIIIDYIAGICIERLTGNNKKVFLTISILSNIGILFVFKYFNFFNENIANIARILHWNYPLELPDRKFVDTAAHRFILPYLPKPQLCYRGLQRASKG
jgi:hypothetical protein